MNYGRLNRLFPITMAILVVALIGLSGCTGNPENGLIVPTFTEPGPPPIEVTIDQLYQEYMTDEAAAKAKYKGERLLFNEVEVEEVVGSLFDVGHGHFVFVNEYFMTGHVKFRLRDFGIMQNIEVGYVLNLVGECQGLQGLPREIVAIYDCWVESVIGDLGEGYEWIDPY